MILFQFLAIQYNLLYVLNFTWQWHNDFLLMEDYCRATGTNGRRDVRLKPQKIRTFDNGYYSCSCFCRRRAISWSRMTDRTRSLPALTSLSWTCACVSWLIISPFSLTITSPACKPAVWARPPIVTLLNKQTNLMMVHLKLILLRKVFWLCLFYNFVRTSIDIEEMCEWFLSLRHLTYSSSIA